MYLLKLKLNIVGMKEIASKDKGIYGCEDRVNPSSGDEERFPSPHHTAVTRINLHNQARKI